MTAGKRAFDLVVSILLLALLWPLLAALMLVLEWPTPKVS